MSPTVSRRMVLKSFAGVSAGFVLGFNNGGLPTAARTCVTSESTDSGILSVTRSKPALTVPRDGAGFRYGTGYVFQVGPQQAALLANLRTEGYPVGDFEAGVDAIVFDDRSGISSAEPVPITRTTRYADRVTGQSRIVIKHGVKGGFVPLEARRSDGSPHPHAGTGVGFCEALDFPMTADGSYDKRDKTGDMTRTTEVQQFVFDGRKFRVSRVDVYTQSKPLCAPGSKWKIYGPSLRMGIPDGDDLLFAVAATTNDASDWFSDPQAAGVSRWRRIAGLWQPVAFAPIAVSRRADKPQVVYGREMTVMPIEPTLVRDIDGSLLFTARFAYEVYDEHALRVWRSADSRPWKRIIECPETKGQAPVSINRAVNGAPYIVSTPLNQEREKLVMWPLNKERTGFDQPITVRDARLEFGPPPTGPVWFMDHANASVVRLSDGRWHNLLVYRVMDRGEHSGKPPAPQSGVYVEEVESSGDEVPLWKF